MKIIGGNIVIKWKDIVLRKIKTRKTKYKSNTSNIINSNKNKKSIIIITIIPDIFLILIINNNICTQILQLLLSRANNGMLVTIIVSGNNNTDSKYITTTLLPQLQLCINYLKNKFFIIKRNHLNVIPVALFCFCFEDEKIIYR